MIKHRLASAAAAAIVSTALSVAAGHAFAGQAPVTKSSSVTATATIEAIDTTARTIVLRNESGETDAFSVSSDVTRFNELKVGDKVKMTYYESVVFQVRKAGEKPGATSAEAAVQPTKGPLPAGTASVQEKMTVTIKAIDPAVPSVTVTTPNGHVVTRRIENKKNLAGLKVGDLIDITYTRALLTSVERAK